VKPIILLAGPSGSGKTRLGRHSGAFILRLDDFYLDEDSPDMPRAPGGFIDWDNPLTWDAEAAVRALASLAVSGTATAPAYDISTSQRVGTRDLDARDARLIVAEGIFATELLALCLRERLDARGIWVDRHRAGNWWRRLNRDLHDHRKPVPMLLRRGAQLFQAEPALRRAAIAKGFSPLSYAATQAALSTAKQDGPLIIANT
jgi:uridine kinase